MPVWWRGTLIQYAGRLHRFHPGKKEVRIYDYVDREVATGRFVGPELRVHIVPAPEKLAEQRHLCGRCLWCRWIGKQGEPAVRSGGLESGQLAPEGVQAAPQLLALLFHNRESGFLTGDRLTQRPLRGGRSHDRARPFRLIGASPDSG